MKNNKNKIFCSSDLCNRIEIWNSPKKYTSLPVGGETGESLATDGVTICWGCEDATVPFVWVPLVCEDCSGAAVWVVGCCWWWWCCWIDSNGFGLCDNNGGLWWWVVVFCPVVSSPPYIALAGCVWWGCPHQGPAAAFEPAETSWWGSYSAHASGKVE